MQYNIQTNWDDESGVWIATSDDIPGLVLESGSLDALMVRVKIVVPELLQLNGINEKEIPLHFTSERFEQVYV